MALTDPHAITPDDTPSTDHIDPHRVYALGSHKVHVSRTT